MHREGDPRPTWRSEERPTGNYSHMELFPPGNDPFPLWHHTGLNPKTTLFPLQARRHQPCGVLEAPFHVGILGKWFQELIRGRGVQGIKDSPAVVHSHQVGDQDEGVGQHAGKELQGKRGLVGCSPFPPHGESHPTEGAHSCHLHGVTRVLHGASLGLIWLHAHPGSCRILGTHHSLGKGSTFLPVAVLTPVTAWE